jgi:hypothetical protein
MIKNMSKKDLQTALKSILHASLMGSEYIFKEFYDMMKAAHDKREAPTPVEPNRAQHMIAIFLILGPHVALLKEEFPDYTACIHIIEENYARFLTHMEKESVVHGKK